MNAIVLYSVGDLRFEQVPMPTIAAGMVRVQVKYCGVCGSDIPRCFEKGTYRFPTICGHEFSGVVEGVGTGVTSVGIGDPIVVFPLIWRDDHPACEQGRYNQSDGYEYLGSRNDGGFAEYVLAPQRNVIRIPDGVTFEQAAMTEPMAVALHAVRRSRVCVGETAVVFGLGPIGLLVAQWLRAAGARPIILFDVQPGKLDLARSLGFQHVYDSRVEEARVVVEQFTNGHGVHVAIEAAGVPAATIAALESVRRSGRVVLLGNPSADISLPMALVSRVMRREVTLFGTWNSDYSVYGDDDEWRTSLAAIAGREINVDALITHKVPLSAGIQALRMMRNQTEFYSKVMIAPTA